MARIFKYFPVKAGYPSEQRIRLNSPTSFGERLQNVRVPGAVQPQAFVEFQVGCANLEPCRVDTKQHPWQVALGLIHVSGTHHDWCSTGATVGPGVCQEVTLPLEAQAK